MDLSIKRLLHETDGVIEVDAERQDSLPTNTRESTDVVGPDSIEHLYNEHVPMMLGFAARFLAASGRSNQAEDMVLITMWKAWRALETAPVREVAAKGWLYKILINTMRDDLRILEHDQHAAVKSLAKPVPGPWGKVVELGTLLPDPATSGATILERLETRESIEAALSHLNPNQRLILHLRVEVGFSEQEVADMLELSPAAVKSRLARVRAKLRRVFEQIDPELVRGRSLYDES